MAQVDFGYVGQDGVTIYRQCFEQYIGARYTFKKPEAEWKELVTKTEEVFYYLVAEGKKQFWKNQLRLEKLVSVLPPDAARRYAIISSEEESK